MNQSKKYILQATIVALMLNSAIPAQAIDWSYWSNCARDGVSGFLASVPTTNQVIDRLKQPKVLGALAVVSVVAAVGLYYMNSTSQQQQKDDVKVRQHPITQEEIESFLAYPLPGIDQVSAELNLIHQYCFEWKGFSSLEMKQVGRQVLLKKLRLREAEDRLVLTPGDVFWIGRGNTL